MANKPQRKANKTNQNVGKADSKVLEPHKIKKILQNATELQGHHLRATTDPKLNYECLTCGVF